MLNVSFINIAKTIFFRWLSVFTPMERLFFIYLLSALPIAWLVWRYEIRNSHKEDIINKHFFSYIFQPSIYRHRSSIQDYFIYFFNRLIYYAFIAQFILLEKPVATFICKILQDFFDPVIHPWPISINSTLLWTVTIAILYDFAIYISHIISHKFSIFWAFHKVHHSAEVLTPVTIFRVHPVDLLISVPISMIFTGIGLGAFSYLAAQKVTIISVFGSNIVIFLFYIFGAHLRHSHVWLHYPEWLTYILISPAQHQIHHSSNIRHHDRNFGFIFSFWDRLFGTLYSPQEKENIIFGVNKTELNPYVTLTQLYLRPFIECYYIILNFFSTKIQSNELNVKTHEHELFLKKND